MLSQQCVRLTTSKSFHINKIHIENVLSCPAFLNSNQLMTEIKRKKIIPKNNTMLRPINPGLMA